MEAVATKTVSPRESQRGNVNYFLYIDVVYQEADGHEGAKPQRVVFCDDLGYLFSAGFSKMSDRQYAVWDAVSLLSKLVFKLSFT